MDVILIITILGYVFPIVSPVVCPEDINNGHVDESCSRENLANCTYHCGDDCNKDSNVSSLICKNGTWYSDRLWTMDTESPCLCDHMYKLKIVFLYCGGIIGLVCVIRATNGIGSRLRRRRMSGAVPILIAYRRTQPAAQHTATVSTQRAEAENEVSSPICMLSTSALYQSVQYTASQNSCYSVPETTSSKGSAYPDAPPDYSDAPRYPNDSPSYNSIIAEAKPGVFSPPPSYEEENHLMTYSTFPPF